MVGITVTLHIRTQSGMDSLNVPTYTTTDVEVEDVLYGPAANSDITDSVQLDSRKEAYTLYIPDGDDNVWVGNTVTFNDKTFSVVGIPGEYISDNLPLKWNKVVQVERYVL